MGGTSLPSDPGQLTGSKAGGGFRGGWSAARVSSPMRWPLGRFDDGLVGDPFVHLVDDLPHGLEVAVDFLFW